MTAPNPKITITPEIVAAFDSYLQRHPAWGVLHVSLDDGNWKTPMAWALTEDSTAEERELVRMHDLMSPSQRRRLAARCSAAVAVGKDSTATIIPWPEPLRVTFQLLVRPGTDVDALFARGDGLVFEHTTEPLDPLALDVPAGFVRVRGAAKLEASKAAGMSAEQKKRWISDQIAERLRGFFEGAIIENPVTVDIRCACGNHARYLVLAPGATLCCALCAMKSPHRTMRIADDLRLAKVMEEMRERMAADAINAAANMHAIVRRRR